MAFNPNALSAADYAAMQAQYANPAYSQYSSTDPYIANALAYAQYLADTRPRAAPVARQQPATGFVGPVRYPELSPAEAAAPFYGYDVPEYSYTPEPYAQQMGLAALMRSQAPELSALYGPPVGDPQDAYSRFYNIMNGY